MQIIFVDAFITLKPRVGHPAKEGLRQFFKEAIKFFIMPRVGHPAKEGLRLNDWHEGGVLVPQSRSSSKRGIKTTLSKIIVCCYLPRVGHPAKEGLRLIREPCQSVFLIPRVGHPAKEGLRLFSPLWRIKPTINPE